MKSIFKKNKQTNIQNNKLVDGHRFHVTCEPILHRLLTVALCCSFITIMIEVREATSLSKTIFYNFSL